MILVACISFDIYRKVGEISEYASIPYLTSRFKIITLKSGPWAGLPCPRLISARSDAEGRESLSRISAFVIYS